MPAGDESNGVVWQSLGTFSTTTGTLAVRLGDNANGYVIADAVRIVLNGIAPQQPEMDVAGLASIATGDSAPSADDGTDFGTVGSDTGSVSETFTISNNGNASLHLTGSPRVVIAGDDPQDFSVVTQPAATVAPGNTTTFTLMFHPTAPGVRTAVVSIANDDDDEHPYTFTIQGTGADPGPTQFLADDSSANFTAAGGWTTNANASAYLGEMETDAAGSGSDHATWSFSGLAPGTYTVYATWVAAANRASNAPFTIADGAVSQTDVAVNQQQAPSGYNDAGLAWSSLTTLYVTSGTLSVGLTNHANGVVVADGIELVRVDLASTTTPPAPPFAPIAHNAAMALDVNGDSRVSATDALIVINQLLNSGATSQSASANALAAPAVASPAATSQTRQYYMDVNNDGRISTLDALYVINYLLHPTSMSAATSGASSATPAVAPPVSAVPAATTAAATVLSPQAVDVALADLGSASATTVPAANSAAPAASTENAVATALPQTPPLLANASLKLSSATSGRITAQDNDDPETTAG